MMEKERIVSIAVVKSLQTLMIDFIRRGGSLVPHSRQDNLITDLLSEWRGKLSVCKN